MCSKSIQVATCMTVCWFSHLESSIISFTNILATSILELLQVKLLYELCARFCIHRVFFKRKSYWLNRKSELQRVGERQTSSVPWLTPWMAHQPGLVRLSYQEPYLGLLHEWQLFRYLGHSQLLFQGLWTETGLEVGHWGSKSAPKASRHRVFISTGKWLLVGDVYV